MNPVIKPVPFSRPSLAKEEEEAVLAVLRSGWLTTGPEVARFEQEFSRYTGAEYCLAVNSATAGLHLALEALGIRRGDRVLTTSYTFTATAEVIRYVGADPVLADIDEDGNIDPAECRRILEESSGIKAIIPVHLGGRLCRMEEISALAEEFGIAVIEDAAHAFPVSTPAGFAGTLGDFGVFSFYASKTITTGEGGMVICRDRHHYERMKTMRLHGIDRDVWNRFTDVRGSWEYDIVAPGFKYNMTDISGALGRVQLGKAGLFLNDRVNQVAYYRKHLEGLPGLKLPSEGAFHAWHLFPVSITDKSTLNRDDLAVFLQERKIGISVHYRPLHMMTYYRERYGFRDEDFPVSLQRYRTTLSLPLYPGLTKGQQDNVIANLKEGLCRKKN